MMACGGGDHTFQPLAVETEEEVTPTLDIGETAGLDAMNILGSPENKDGEPESEWLHKLAPSGKIVIAHASQSELVTLPRIGKVTATRIIDFCHEHGSPSLGEIMAATLDTWLNLFIQNKVALFFDWECTKNIYVTPSVDDRFLEEEIWKADSSAYDYDQTVIEGLKTEVDNLRFQLGEAHRQTEQRGGEFKLKYDDLSRHLQYTLGQAQYFEEQVKRADSLGVKLELEHLKFEKDSLVEEQKKFKDSIQMVRTKCAEHYENVVSSFKRDLEDEKIKFSHVSSDWEMERRRGEEKLREEECQELMRKLR
jgi:hypothetical protein